MKKKESMALEQFDKLHPEFKPQSEQESQEDLWRRVERYIDWPYQEINVTELMKQFTITRKP